MAARWVVPALFGLLSLAALAIPAAAGTAFPDGQKTLARMPAWFEPLPAANAYVSQGGAGSLHVSGARAEFHSAKGKLAIELAGANPAAAVEGVSALAGRSAYLRGNDRSRWAHDVPHFAKVRAREVYPGIDVLYYMAAEREIEFDFVVAPGADPKAIRFVFDGAGRPRLDASTGDLVFANGIRQKSPVAYQTVAGNRVLVASAYRLTGGGEVRLRLGDYDRRLPLVIDPILQTGYLGGDVSERANAVTIDPQGNVWITGSSASAIRAPGQSDPFQEELKGKRDVFVARFTRDESGNLNLAYWTLIGGSEDDEANAISYDDAGFLYIGGVTSSNDFPRAGTPIRDSLGGASDGFIIRFRVAAAGADVLWFSQFYGGATEDAVTALVVESAGVVYIAGNTSSLEGMPGVSEAQLQCCNRGGVDAFFARIQTDLSPTVTYASYFGGSSADFVRGIGLDAQGRVYLAGFTSSTDFPVTEGSFRAPTPSAYVAQIDIRRPALDALLYCTWIGGSDLDYATSLLVLPDGTLWVGGYTLSLDFPTTANAHRRASAGGTDVFLVKFDPSKGNTPEAIQYSTYLGGQGGDVLLGLQAAPGGLVALTGYTYSTDFPIANNPDQVRRAGPGADAFVTLLNPNQPEGAALVFSGTTGGALNDIGSGVAVDAAGNVFVVGSTFSPDLPVSDNTRKQTPGGFTQGFFFRARAPQQQ